jgi:hypothetical protein
MKLPSLFKTSQHMRFEIKPRYYDPIKEEIEQRTSRIKRELIAEGQLSDDTDNTDPKTFGVGSSIRGSFTQGGQIRGRSSSVLTSAGLLRLLIFLLLLGGIFGYIYYGEIIFHILLYAAAGVFGVIIFNRLKNKSKK